MKTSVVGHGAWVIGVLCGLSCFSQVHVAQAGSWSGPVYKVTARSPDDTRPAAAEQPVGGAGGISPASPYWLINDGGSHASGTVTATFTYHPDLNDPDDVAPEAVAVSESASAQWYVIGSAPGGGRDSEARTAPSQPASPESDSNRPSAKYTLLRPSKRPSFVRVQSSGNSASGSVSNGLGDGTQPIQYGEISSGTHVKFYRVRDNRIVTDAITPSASCQASYPHTRWSYSAQLSDHSLYISSDIEKSFKKGTGPLPSAYTKVDAAGHPLYESQQVAGMGTADTSDDVWKLECIRERDGLMSVHSAADWDRVAHSYAGAWYGGGTFSANDSGYVSPKYQWTWSGGTPEVLAASDVAEDRPDIRMGGGSRLPHTVSGDVNLGGQEDGSGITTSSDVTVDVSEKANDLPTSLLTAKYKVNWHLPVEGRTLRPSTSSVQNPFLSSIDNFATANPDPLFGINISTNIEQTPLPVHYQALTATGGYVVSTATAGGVGWGLLALGVVAPEVVLPVSALAGAVGYAVVTNLPENNPTVGFENSFLKWQEAVNATRSGDIRITPPELANDPNALNPNPSINTAWKSCSMQVRVRQDFKTSTFVRDTYGFHGYSGQATEFIDKTDGVPVYYAIYKSASQ